MSAEELQEGDIRADRAMIYLVISRDGVLEGVWFTGHSLSEEYLEGMGPSKAITPPSLKHKFICNINRALFIIEKKIQKEILKCDA